MNRREKEIFKVTELQRGKQCEKSRAWERKIKKKDVSINIRLTDIQKKETKGRDDSKEETKGNAMHIGACSFQCLSLFRFVLFVSKMVQLNVMFE